MTRILVVEPDPDKRNSLKSNLVDNGFEVATAPDLPEVSADDVSDVGAIVSSASLPTGNGVDLVAMCTDVPVIILAESASVASAVEAMRNGVRDFLLLPLAPDELIAAVERVVEPRTVPRSTTQSDAAWPMLGTSPPMVELFERIHKVAPTESTVLIQGESGTGKELVARALHSSSHRQHAPMISLNCAAIPETLIESELFGHERGAFTGANVARNGLIEAADEGTLFLDEIGELPMEAQARLLRVLQDGEIRRVGSTQTRVVNVRLITATHRDLKQLTDNHQFREDLFYRLNVVTLVVPPLRARGHDVTELAHATLQRTSQKLGKADVRFADDALEAMQNYPWPGNVRELENAVERAVILTDANEIPAALLAIDTSASMQPMAHHAQNDRTSLEDYFVRFVTDHEDQYTETELARKLGISRKSLWERRQRLNVPRRRTRKRGPRRDT